MRSDQSSPVLHAVHSCGAVADFHRLPEHSSNAIFYYEDRLPRVGGEVKYAELGEICCHSCGLRACVRCARSSAVFQESSPIRFFAAGSPPMTDSGNWRRRRQGRGLRGTDEHSIPHEKQVVESGGPMKGIGAFWKKATVARCSSTAAAAQIALGPSWRATACLTTAGRTSERSRRPGATA